MHFIQTRRAQVKYFISLMKAELSRNREILTPAALSEFEQALKVYQSLLPQAR